MLQRRDREEDESHRRRGRGAAALTVAVSVGSARDTRSAAAPKNCAFTLRIGDVLPFTGDLAAYGANLDRAVKAAIAPPERGAEGGRACAKSIQVTLVGSEDGQTQASASVEAATKLVKSNNANVMIGEMASSATIPMAQSVAIPNQVVQISPTSSAPQLTDIKDNGYLWRAYPSDTLQGKVLAQAAIDAFGKGATLNVGARNDAFGTALKQLFVAQYEKLGGKIGVNISWNPTQANFDTEAQQLVDGSPAGWVIIDFPETFEKFAPSLVRTGKWDATKTFMTEALRNTDGAGQDRQPGRRAARHSGERRRRAGRRRRSPRTGRRTSRARSRTPASRARRSTRRTWRSSPRCRRARPRPRRSRRTSSASRDRPARRSPTLQLAKAIKLDPLRQGGRLRGRVQPGRLRRARATSARPCSRSGSTRPRARSTRLKTVTFRG